MMSTDEESAKPEEKDGLYTADLDFAVKKQEIYERRELEKVQRAYSESFLKRVVRLVEIFTSISTVAAHPMSMVQKVANPYQLQTIINLLLVSSPRVQIVVLKII